MLGGSCAHHCRWIQHHDPLVALAQSQFILGADHAVAFLPADLALLDGDGTAIGHVQGGTHGGHQHLLPGSHIGGTAYDVRRLATAEINRTQAQAIGVRMFRALQHLPHHHTGQVALDGLVQRHALTLQTRASEDRGRLLRT